MIDCTFEDGGKVHLRHVVVDGLIIKDDKILLVKRSPKLFTEPNKWCLPGGYLNLNETTEQAILREVREETGYKCEIIELLAIINGHQRVHVKRQDIPFVYILRPVEHHKERDEESTEMRWFLLTAIPKAEEIAFDHLSMIDAYKRYKQGELQLPIIGEL
jgi:8-oxo-dGTP diphosphatase